MRLGKKGTRMCCPAKESPMKRLLPVLQLGFVAALLLATAPALAQGSYTQIDVPGAVSTVGLGIDTAGDLVGFYGDASGNVDGFLFSGGTYATIDPPGSTITQ